MSSGDNNKEPGGDLAVSLVAMLAQTGTPTGSVPTDVELRKYFEGRLTVERRAEIESHLAHSPAVMDAYLALIASDLAREPDRSAAASAPASNSAVPQARSKGWLEWFSGWQRPLAAVGASLAIGAIALQVVISSGGDDETQTIRVRSLRPDTAVVEESSDWRENAFVAGLRAGRPAAAGCLGADCATESRAISELGAVTAAIAAACDSGRAIEPALAARARNVRSDIETRTWSRLADRVAEAAESGRGGCRTIALIAAGER